MPVTAKFNADHLSMEALSEALQQLLDSDDVELLEDFDDLSDHHETCFDAKVLHKGAVYIVDVFSDGWETNLYLKNENGDTLKAITD